MPAVAWEVQSQFAPGYMHFNIIFWRCLWEDKIFHNGKMVIELFLSRGRRSAFANAEQIFKLGSSQDLLWKLWIFREISMTPLTPTHSAQYCVLAALLLHALPHDGTYVAVAGLFLAMKVQPPVCWLLAPAFTHLAGGATVRSACGSILSTGKQGEENSLQCILFKCCNQCTSR